MDEPAVVFYDGRSPVGRPARLRADEALGRLEVKEEATGAVLFSMDLAALRPDPPVGTGRWVFDLGNGAACEGSPEVYDWISARVRPSPGARFSRWAEARWRVALACFAGSLLILALLFHTGLPYMAERAAHSLPLEIDRAIGREALRLLDRTFFLPSALEEGEQAEIRAEFADWIGRSGWRNVPTYRIEFRRSRIGPNAFALPGGLILLTDELIEMADDRRQIHGVVAHELGHVFHRHGTQAALRSAGHVFVVTFFLGDVANVLAVGAALPTVLVETGHSRRFEREADTFAAEFALAAGFGVEPLIELLETLERRFGGGAPPGWLSTHPPTPERVALMRAVAEREEREGK